MQEVALAPDERAVQEFVAACLYPSFHDRIHSGHLDADEHDRDARVLENRVDRAGNLPSRSRIRNRCWLPAFSKSMTRFLAAWTTQEDEG